MESNNIELTGELAEKLSKAIIHIFGDYNSLQQFVMFKFSLNLVVITPDKSLNNAVFSLIQWAKQEGKENELVEKVVNEKPNNPKIKEFLSFLAPRSSEQIDDRIIEPETKIGKKKILFIYSNFEHATQIRVGSELKEINNCFDLKRSVKSYDFFIQTKHQMTPKDAVDAIKEAPIPFIVHISVHGKKGEGLVFNSATNTEIIIDSDAVSFWFLLLKLDNIKPNCILINACHSEEIIKKIAGSVEYAIGMSTAILDEAAISFSGGFYSELLKTVDIERAFVAGVSAIANSGLYSRNNIKQYSIPQIYKQSKLITDKLIVI